MKETISAMVVAAMKHIPQNGKVEMIRQTGSASVLTENIADIKTVLPDITDKWAEVMKTAELQYKWAEEELKFCQDKGIRVIPYTADDYPQRLKECSDAPIVLYYKGTADLNRQHIVSIVGTRHCTAYGQDCIRHFIDGLSAQMADVLIVSGLAYGIDICAHRHALADNCDTIGVLAHGLDTIYPSSHRETARQMTKHGGLLTEYPTRSKVDKVNFISRNRIVAGMADATIVVESAAKGGGLITAGIARSYARDVFAFPGRTNDHYSTGCNNMIRDNEAAMITSADDFMKMMRWQSDDNIRKMRGKAIEKDLFTELNSDEQKIVAELKRNNDLQINQLTANTNISINKLSPMLFELEMKGIIKAYAGGIYHLL